ncbi:GFA family protein [Pseudaquabacterium pictum]|uniref:Aldehyde-activating protein n=1 Tax=Pseudaquabacterium pictum TaxID=2315236 RepID=A0A480ALW1_9BURK|nr:GFA family protein [Rubrivivax pictus]GCL61720.1 aldehyde-activating protein [Rubrivivax pictus]
MHIDGSCHCGAVRFTALIDPGRVMVCHCADCQVLSGAPFRAVAVAPYDTLHVTGTTKSYVKLADSGNRRAQVFCPECATPLWATAPENPTSVVIRLGCVTQRAQLTPAVQIWQHSALPWVADLLPLPGSPAQQAFLPAAPPTGAA